MKKSVGLILICLLAVFCGCSNHIENNSNVPESPQSSFQESVQTSETAEISLESSIQSSTESVSSKPQSSNESEKSDTESSYPAESSVSKAESSDESIVSKSESSLSQSVVSNTESSEETVVSQPELWVEEIPVPDKSVVYDFESKYFINKLEEKELSHFLQLYDGAKNFKECVYFSRSIPSEELDGLMLLLNYDCPELIQLNGDYIPIYADADYEKVSGVGFIYNMEKEEYEEHNEELFDFFDELKDTLKDKTELEQEKYIYDYIFNNCIYDDSDKYSGTVYGTLINHIGRCEGICKSLMWCMRELGNECICVSGTPKWETTAVYSAHSWNIVKIDGQYYQLDLTIDNLNFNRDDNNFPNYGFFNVSDEFNNRTHEVFDFYAQLGLPECTSDEANYHKMNNLLVFEQNDMKEQVYEILENNLIDGKADNVSIKFESREDFENTYDVIDEWLNEFFEQKSIDYFYYNYLHDSMCQTLTVFVEIAD